MKKMRFFISKLIALCLIVLCILSTIGLCFAVGNAKWLLMSGCIFSLITLFIYIIKYPPVITVEKVVTQIVKQEVQVPVSAEAKKEAIQGMLKYASEETPVEENGANQNASPVHKEQDLEITRLLSSLEEKHINVFERHLQDCQSDMTEEEQDGLFEEFVDIGLLAMDFINIQTRTVCSYADITKERIDKQSEKNDILRQIDPFTRLSQKYGILSRILQAKLPGKSFLYSGYKL